MSPFRKFLLISVLIHIVVLLLILFALKTAKEKAQAPMMATLISPEEMLKQVPPVKHVTRPLGRKPARAFRPRYRPSRMRHLPPPTRQELKHMPLYGVPRPGGLKGPRNRQQEARSAPPGPVKGGNGGKGPALRGTSGRQAAGKNSRAGNPGAGPGRSVIGRELFDQDVINRLVAKNDESGTGRERAKGAVTFDTGDMRYYGYMQRLKQKIESVWVYPGEAIRKGLYGEVEINFTILKDGSLGDVTVVNTSGYPVLDEAALKALRDGQPYWPLPDAWGVKSFTVDGHFLYTNYGNGIE